LYVARWALIGAALLAAFQAWLWTGQQSLIGLVVCVASAVPLVAAVHLPGTRYAEVLQKVWALPRGADESERRYRFKIAIAWLAVVAACVIGCIVLSVTAAETQDGIDLAGMGLRVFGFVAALMALQSFLVALFRSPARVPTNQSLERMREG
jgi:hypothetical protein